jgi:hypothetical protein
MVLHACVPDCELAATALAPDQTGQQRVSVLGRAVISTSGNVAADHCADRLELRISQKRDSGFAN